MGRYAMIEDGSQIVVNVIEWSGDTADWQPPAGYTMVEDTQVRASAGTTYDGTTFIAPPTGGMGTRAVAELAARTPAVQAAKEAAKATMKETVASKKK